MLSTLALLVGLAAFGQTEGPRTYPLWPKEPAKADPGDENHSGDIPTITVYLPPKEKKTGASIIICPGGGYEFLAVEHEGKEVAEWLNSLGIAGIVLKYRIAPKYRYPAPLDDARRAMRMVRWRSESWGLDPDRVGVMGFSAGGHLASTLATDYREAHPIPGDPINGFSERPNVAILIYPVITLAAPYNQRDTGQNLLGPDATKDQWTALCTDTKVTEKTPPTFLAHTPADVDVPIENSFAFAQALRKNKVPFELHVFQKGPHGLGLGKGAKQFGVLPDPAFEAWPPLCATWLKLQGFLDKQPDKAAEIGHAIQTVDHFLTHRLPANPTDADREEAADLWKKAVTVGQLTQLYPWVLGRLKGEIAILDRSLRDMPPQPVHEKEVKERIEFLQRLIVAIDAPY